VQRRGGYEIKNNSTTSKKLKRQADEENKLANYILKVKNGLRRLN
jgi:hypothetical protein